MAWLFLDTHAPGEAYFAILEEGKLPRVIKVEGRTTGLLPKLAKILGTKGINTIKGVCVVAGPGSFSSVRSGVLDANMIARLLDVPLVGVTVEESHDLPVFSHKLLSTHYSLLTSHYIAPIYDKEPNITLPKLA